MRRITLICLLALALAVIIAANMVSRAQEPGPMGFFAYLPLGAKSVDLGALPHPSTPNPYPTPSGIPATPTDNPSPTPAPTETSEPATNTPEPPTETPEPEGRVTGRLLVEGNPAVEGTGFAGPALWLRRCQGPDCTTVGRSGVIGVSGIYTFEGVPALPPGSYYQVTWQNEDAGGEVYAHPFLLGSWYGLRITQFDGSGEVSGGDIELADIELVSPTHGTGFQGLPIPFQWRTRPGSEIYRWGLTQGCGLLETRKQPVMLTESLGRNSRYELTRHPPGVRWGNDNHYCWFIRLETPDGYGESFYSRIMWFIPDLLPPDLVSAAQRLTRPDPSKQADSLWSKP